MSTEANPSLTVDEQKALQEHLDRTHNAHEIIDDFLW